jgi:acyl dehydratase
VEQDGLESLSSKAARPTREGAFFECSVSVTEDLIKRFAAFSGDRNPIHLSDEAARRQGFQRRVAHSVIQAALVSAMVGMELPGPGSVLQRFEMKWLKPCYEGDQIRLRLEVTEIHESVQAVICRITVNNQQGRLFPGGWSR